MAVKVDAPVADKDVPATVEQKAEEANPMDELLILGPDPTPLAFRNGKSVVITPLKMNQIRQLHSVLGNAAPIIDTIAGEYAATGAISIQRLAAVSGEEFYPMIAIASKMTEDEINDLDIDEFMILVTKIIVVNLDFFGRTLPGLLKGLGASVQNTMASVGGGPTPSKSS